MTSGALCLGIGKTRAPISLVIFVKHKRTAHSSVQILRVRVTNTTAELNVKIISEDLECKSNERRKGRDKQSEENGKESGKKNFSLIGEKARAPDRKGEPHQTTGDRTQGKEKGKTDRE